MSADRWTERNLVGSIARSVWQWQLILTLSVVVMGAVVAVLDPHLFGSVPFLTGLLLIVAIGLAAIGLDWTRHPTRVALTVPLLDTAAIGLLAASTQPFSFLWCFPVAWIATYYGTPALVSALGIALATQVPQWWNGGRTVETTLTLLIIIVSLGFLGITISIGTRRTRALRHLMRRQSQQLDRAIQRIVAEGRRADALFDAVGVALARVDEHGQLLAANAAYRALYSYPGDDLTHPSSAVEYADYLGDALSPDQTAVARAAAGERVTNERMWLYDATGEWRALSLSIRERNIDAGGARGAIIEIVDDSASVRQQTESRSQASAVSHELRNPLTAILGHADLLLDDEALDPAAKEHAKVIENAAERMLVLIRGLLGNTQPSDRAPRDFDLGSVTASAVAAFSPTATAKNVTVVDEISRSLPVSGDGFRMRQVVDNLISNAIKYTPRGGTVVVSTSSTADTAELRIADTGIGIGADDLVRVFDPYFRAQSATDGHVGGTGLGMGIARDIVRHHHGDITVTSALGQGTTVTVTLPTASTLEGEGRDR